MRQALVDSQDGDTIDFDPSLKGQTISLTSAELFINKSTTISGLGPNLLAVSRAQNAPAFRIFNLMPGRSVTIQGLTISNGLAPEFGCGGGILDEGSSLSLISCTVSGNSTDGTGGGICADANATLTIDSSTLSGNYAGDYGGGIANSGTLTINNSTLSDNRGEFTGGAILNGFNGGASLIVSNSTLSGNTTQLHGGGIFNEGQSAIGNSTLSGNSGMTAGAIYNRLATLDIESTILNRGELGPNILNDSGTVTSHGYNLSSDDGGGVLNDPGDQINTSPLIGPLQNNGGPTFTHQLLPGSPAIDTGDPNFTPPPFLDQRGPGFPRVMNGRIDKGSFEVQGPTPTPTPTATPCASAGTWTKQSPYPIVTSGQAVASQGGNVYSFGGIANNVAIANAYKYSPATNTWTPIASLPQPRGWLSAASDGTYVYLLGGVDQNFTTTATLWRYDPINNTYNTSLPSYTIPTYFHASAYLNGKIYRIAGRAIGTDFHVEVYDIATNTWSMAANYPFANHSLMAAGLAGYIYAGGGNASPDKTYRYDPTSNTWDDATVADLPGDARLPRRVSIMADGSLQEATSTSPSARVRSPGIPVQTLGLTCQTWSKPAITSQARRRANPSMPSPATRPLALPQMITSSTLKPALHRHQRRHRPQHPRLQRQLRQHRLQRPQLQQRQEPHQLRDLIQRRGFAPPHRRDHSLYVVGTPALRRPDSAARCPYQSKTTEAQLRTASHANAWPRRFRPSANISVFTPMPMRK